MITAMLCAVSLAARRVWIDRTLERRPVPRYGRRMAFDSGNDRVLLFGGESADGYLGDLWVWDGDA